MFRFTLRGGGLGPAAGDVGWETWEEVDLSQAGKNYGWPCYEGITRTLRLQRPAPNACCNTPPRAGRTPLRPPAYVYNHNESTGWSSAVVAGPFYNGGPYPDDFDGDWFIGDYAAGWIKRLEFSGGNVSARRDFATDWYGVSIELGPGNELYYTDFGDGSNGSGAVKRIVYTAGANAEPVARAEATPRNGTLPLQVSFSGAASTDGDGDTLTYEWNWGDGTAPGTGRTATHTFTTAMNRDVTLTVRDGKGGVNSTTVRVWPGNTPPVARINAPADNGPSTSAPRSSSTVRRATRRTAS